jgi:hypothetical protein
MTEVLDPPETAALAVLAELDDVLDKVASLGLWSLGDGELLEHRRLLGQAGDRLTAAVLAATGEISVRGATSSVAAVSTHTWLREALGLHPGAAAREVRLAVALRTELPATRAAMAAGRLGPDAAEVIADTDRALARTATAAERADAEAFLAGQAPSLGLRGLQTAGLHLRPGVSDLLCKGCGPILVTG